MKARHHIAAALSFMLSANIVLALLCEVRCDVPRSNAPIASCHESGAPNAASQSPFTIGAVDDRCTHDALPVIVSVVLQKELRAAGDHGPATRPMSDIFLVVSFLSSTVDTARVDVRPSSQAVLRI